jgi:methyl-accepting chemotaxis protein
VNILKNIKVAVRLPFAVLLAVVVLIVFAVTSLTTLGTVKVGGPREQSITQHNTLLADILPPPAYLVETDLAALELRFAAATGDAAGLAEARAQIEAGVALFKERQAYWQDVLEDGNLKTAMAAVDATGMTYIEVLETRVLPAIDAGDIETVDATAPELDRLYHEHRDAVTAAAALIGEQATAITEDSIDLADGREQMLWIMLAITVIMVGAASAIVTISVVKPLQALRVNMDEIANGDGSQSDTRLDEERKDEFGQVAVAFNTFADKLVAYSAEVEANADAAHTRAEAVSAAADVASENMNTVAVATTELSAAASEIARSAGDASRTAETAVRAADNANALMERLAESSDRIGEVVESIRGIAGQTTMLALNATIEAARAGEAGRGFAVVASEVKDLAAETGTATADIVGRVEAIRMDTQAALVALGEVAQVITEISASQSVIAAAVEEQAATTAEIDRSLTEAVTAVNQLAVHSSVQSAATPHNANFTTAA